MMDRQIVGASYGPGKIELDPNRDPREQMEECLQVCVREGQYTGILVAADIARARGLTEFADELEKLSRGVLLDRDTPLPRVVN